MIYIHILFTMFKSDTIGQNLEFARTLLLKLEQDAQLIRVQTKKQELQADLVRKRDLIRELGEKLEDLNEVRNLFFRHGVLV